MTIYHLRDLAAGSRIRVKCEDVKVYQAPHYRGLAIEDMLKFAEGYSSVAKALPSEHREILKLHREYVSTMIYTIVGKPFITWVEKKITDRN
jgi:hypothetical protein